MLKKEFLKIIFLTLTVSSFGQSKKIISLSVTGLDTYYHTANSNTMLGGTIRSGDGFSLSIDVDDTSGKRGGFKIDLLSYSVDNFHKNILPNNQLLNVADDLLLVDYLFRLMKSKGRLITTNVNLGLGLSTLLGRQYYDEYGNDLGYNTSFLKDDVRFGNNFGLMAIGEVECKLRVTKRVTINGGLRFWGSPTGQLTNSSKLTYVAYTGSGFAFTYGASYTF